MNGLIRQLAVLAVLWSACELLLPDGRQQQMVRAAVSVLVLTALLSTAGSWLRGEQAILPAAAQQSLSVSQSQYRRTALTAFANQMQRYCESHCRYAGYEAQAAVYLRMDGSVERIELALEAVSPLMTTDGLIASLCSAMGVDRQCIRLNDAEGT